MADEIAPPMSDNEALRRIVAEFQELREELNGDYDDVVCEAAQTDVAVTNSVFAERAAMSNAVKTVITNRGSNRARIFEDGKLVGLVGSNADEVVPLKGQGAISVRCYNADTAIITITTYIRG